MNFVPVIFEKIKNNHDRLRDDSISGAGIPSSELKIGNHFVMIAAPRDSGFERMVNTSAIVEVEMLSKQSWQITTENQSIYKITYPIDLEKR